MSAVVLRTERPLTSAECLRGAVAETVGADSLFHNHAKDGLIYTYPRVQYKVFRGFGVLVGIAEGAEALVAVAPSIRDVPTEHRPNPVVEMRCVRRSVRLGPLRNLRTYTFLTPWLALGHDNYERYRALATKEERNDLLGRIFVGNVLSMCKSLGLRVERHLSASVRRIGSLKVAYKGVPQIGFYGRVAINFEIPDWLGVGRAPSHGFGAIRWLGAKGTSPGVSLVEARGLERPGDSGPLEDRSPSPLPLGKGRQEV